MTTEGVKPNPDKINVIKNWPIPKNEKEFRGFLGTIGYYRRFIKDLAKIIKPMTNQLKKNEKITHTKEFIESFDKCKELLTSSSVLQYPDFSQPFVLTTDASNYAIGAVLSQGPVGKDRPISFASRTLNKSETGYSVIEKELLAIVWALKYFRPYLYGNEFTLYTDHKPLTYLYNLKDTSGKMLRWRLAIEEFKYEIKYRAGKQNVVADGLSRITHEINANSIEQSDENTVKSGDSDDSNYIHMTEEPINKFHSQIILKISDSESYSHEEIFPKIYRHTIMKQTFENTDIIEILRERIDPKKVNCIMCPTNIIQNIQEVYKDYFSRNKTFKIKMSQTLLEDITELEEQNELIKLTHEKAHRGIEENVKVLTQSYFFPRLKNKTRNYIKLCTVCKKSKYDRHPYKISLAETPIPKKPLDIIHMDIFIAQPNMFISFVDKLSKFAMLIFIQSRTIVDIRKALLTFIATYGTPKIIVTDNEPAFKSIEIRGLLNDLNIESYFTPTDYSQVNGIVERFHSTLAEIFRCIKDKYDDITQNEKFMIALSLYNTTIHSVTNLKPQEVFYGIKEGDERPLNIERIIENRNKVFDEVILKLKEKQKITLDYQNATK